MGRWPIREVPAKAKVERHRNFVRRLAALKIGEGPNVPTDQLIELVDDIKHSLTRKDEPMNASEATVADKIGDIDWPQDLNQGPNGILQACLAAGLKTVGDLATLGDTPMKRTKLQRNLEWTSGVGRKRWDAIQDVIRITKNNAQRPELPIPTAGEKVADALAGRKFQKNTDQIEDEVSVYRRSAPVMDRDPNAHGSTLKAQDKMDFALEAIRDGQNTAWIADRLGMSKATLYGWKSSDMDYRAKAQLAEDAFHRYGPRPGYNGAPDELPGNIVSDGDPEAQEAKGAGDAPVDLVAGEGDQTVRFDPDQHHQPAGRIDFREAPDLANDPGVPIQDRRHDLTGLGTDVQVDDIRDLDKLIAGNCDPECPVIVYVDQEGDIDIEDVHPRLGRDLWRLADSGHWGKDRAEVIANLVAYAIRNLA